MRIDLPYIVNPPDDPDWDEVNLEFVQEFLKAMDVPEGTYHIRHEGHGAKSVGIGTKQSITFDVNEPTIYAIHNWEDSHLGTHFKVPVDDPDAVEKVKAYLAEANA